MAPQASTTPDAQPKSRPSWHAAIRGNVLMMGLVSLFTDASSEMIFPLMPVFLSGLASEPWMAAFYLGLMEGLAETTASILKLFSGRISDRLGKRKILAVVGYGLSTICRPLMSLAQSGLGAVGLRFGDRIGKGVRTSPRDALIGDSVGPDVRGLAFSFHRAMDHTGAIIGAAAAVLILWGFLGAEVFRLHQTGEGVAKWAAAPGEMTAMRWLFAIGLLPGIGAMAFMILKVHDVAVAQPGGKAEEKPTGKPAKDAGGWRHLPGRFYAFVGVVTLFALGNSSDLFLLLRGRELFGLGIAQVLFLWIALHISKTAFSMPGGWLSDRVGRRPVMIAGWAVYAAVYVGMAFVGDQQQGLFWGLLVAYGLFYGLTEGVEKAVVADFVPSQHRGTAYGVYHGAIGIAALPASLLFGIFWASLGPKVAFGIGAGLAGLAAVLLAVLMSASRTEKVEQ